MGDVPRDSSCLDAIRNQNRDVCAACLNSCLDTGDEEHPGCSTGLTGPCVSEFLGSEIGCGLCEFRCRKTYEACLAP